MATTRIRHCARATQGTGGCWPHLSLAERALVRSQSGPLASVPFTALPIHRISRMDPEPFRVLLLRRLRMPPPPQCSRLPVWPSTRRPWPPPRSVQQGWGVGQKGVRCRKCCHSDLQGRRRASVHQRHAPGPGHIPATQFRWTTFRSGGRRVVFVRRVPTCLGCHRCPPRSTEMEHTGGRRTWRMGLR